MRMLISTSRHIAVRVDTTANGTTVLFSLSLPPTIPTRDSGLLLLASVQGNTLFKTENTSLAYICLMLIIYILGFFTANCFYSAHSLNGLEVQKSYLYNAHPLIMPCERISWIISSLFLKWNSTWD